MIFRTTLITELGKSLAVFLNNSLNFNFGKSSLVLEAGLNRALVEIVISANVPYPLTQNLWFGFLCLIQNFKTESIFFFGFLKNRFPIWVATQNEIFKTD